jgi:two-component system OmpR family response regulator
MRLLVVEDNPELSRRMCDRLRAHGFAVDLAPNYRTAEYWPDLDKFVTIILDLGLPDGNGLDLLKQWRHTGLETPVMILTARGNWQEKVEGLNAGADDFVVKPVRLEELIARINALLRRRHGSREGVIEVGDIRLETLSRCVWHQGKIIDVSRQEFRLLYLFMSRAGQVLSQNDILEHLYELGAERGQNAVEVMISRLRRKVGSDRITTQRGLGYRFER